MFKSAYNKGIQDALARFKLAGPLGADVPPGSIDAHGTTARIPYALRPSANPPPGEPYDDAARERATGRVDWLWNISDIDHMGPGGASDYGTEVIG